MKSKRQRKKERERGNELDEKRRTSRRFGESGRAERRGVWRNERSSNANIRGDRDWNNPPIRIVDVNGIMQIRAVGARAEPGTDWQLPHRSLNSIHRVVLWIVNRASPSPSPHPRETETIVARRMGSRKEDDDRWGWFDRFHADGRNDNAKLVHYYSGDGGGNRSLYRSDFCPGRKISRTLMMITLEKNMDRNL